MLVPEGLTSPDAADARLVADSLMVTYLMR